MHPIKRQLANFGDYECRVFQSRALVEAGASETEVSFGWVRQSAVSKLVLSFKSIMVDSTAIVSLC